MTLMPMDHSHRPFVRGKVAGEWGSCKSVARGGRVTEDVSVLPGFVVTENGDILAFVLYQIVNGECEVTALDSFAEGRGYGSALMAAVEEAARATGCGRVWLSASNDNAHAIRFYQKRGYVLLEVNLGAFAEYRKLKPELPITGNDGIPLRDEFIFAKDL
ncbi:GNAT family N-acetyltransferase [Ruminococcaceae bacterium OttesenSCG-928-D13]|nr:GNAT family N-acetyltransferase [Ruminococcaceae bacterium OttesenSCG-928-D13]